MILNSIGEGLLDQDTLYTSNHNHNTQSNWYTDPDGLCWTLNNYNTNPNVPGFVAYRFDTENEITQKIIYTLYHYKVPVASLVFGCGHWIIVKGYSTDVDPQNTNNYTLNGLYIDNPWPYVPSWDPVKQTRDLTKIPPPPHSINDGCGTGGNRGIASEYVSYSWWKSSYMTGCDVWNIGHNQFVSVCDPEMPRIGRIKMRPDILKRSAELIKDKEVHKILLKGIEHHELMEDKHFADALDNAEMGEPILVQRLDMEDTYYYLVPMRKGGRITAIMSMDGIRGSFQGGRIVTSEMRGDVEEGKYIIDKKVVRDKILKTPIQLPNKRGMLKLHPGTFSIHPVMVWKPCKESRSPYYPFHMVIQGNQIIYIGYDGEVYTELHDLSRGG